MGEAVYTYLSYKTFRWKLNNWSSFEGFLWEAAHSNCPTYSPRASRAGARLDPDFAQGRANTILPRKLKAHFSSEVGKEERKKGLHVAQKVRSRNARHCIFCSSTTNIRTSDGKRKTSRMGRRTRTECSKCGVALCTSLPPDSNDRRTCFEKWHKRRSV